LLLSVFTGPVQRYGSLFLWYSRDLNRPVCSIRSKFQQSGGLLKKSRACRERSEQVYAYFSISRCKYNLWMTNGFSCDIIIYVQSICSDFFDRKDVFYV